MDKAGARDVARMTLDRISLGHRASSRAEFEPKGEARAFEVGAEQLHELRLERDLSDWRFYVDEKLIGTLGVSKLAERPQFHLVAEGGPAWFGDAFVKNSRNRQSSRIFGEINRQPSSQHEFSRGPGDTEVFRAAGCYLWGIDFCNKI